MNKSWIRITAIIAAAALVLGTVAAALSTWAIADDEPPVPDSTSTSQAQEPPTPEPTADIESLAREALASLASRLGVSEAHTEQALRQVAEDLAPRFQQQQRPDPVEVRQAAVEGLAGELGLPVAAVQTAVTEQLIESYATNRPLVDAYLDRAVSTGELTAAEAEQFKQQLADGSLGTR